MILICKVSGFPASATSHLKKTNYQQKSLSIKLWALFYTCRCSTCKYKAELNICKRLDILLKKVQCDGLRQKNDWAVLSSLVNVNIIMAAVITYNRMSNNQLS